MTTKRKTGKAKAAAPGKNRRPAGKPGRNRPPGSGAGRPAVKPGHGTPPPTPPDSYWIYGLHAVQEAADNQAREIKRVLLADRLPDRSSARVEAALAGRNGRPPIERVERSVLDRLLGEEAVHQGVALCAAPLAQPDLAVMVRTLPAGRHTVVALDQVTDPHNVGAILRSAAAFGATAVVTTRRNAPPEGGVLAKAASGALEHVAYIQETNLVRALEELKAAGFHVLGLAERGEPALPQAAASGDRHVLVLGAEGKGLRALVSDTCDRLIRLPTGGPIGALNVSNAAAVALYELSGRRADNTER